VRVFPGALWIVVIGESPRTFQTPKLTVRWAKTVQLFAARLADLTKIHHCWG